MAVPHVTSRMKDLMALRRSENWAFDVAYYEHGLIFSVVGNY